LINAKGDAKVAVIEGLLDNLDTKAFSLWFGKYNKASSEGKEKIKTNNLLNGYVRSCEPLKKRLFASYGYYGEEPDLQIRGVYLWHDADFLPEMKEHYVCEYIDWRKIDPTNAEDRKLVIGAWTSLEEGTTFQDLPVGNVKLIH